MLTYPRAVQFRRCNWRTATRGAACWFSVSCLFRTHSHTQCTLQYLQWLDLVHMVLSIVPPLDAGRPSLTWSGSRFRRYWTARGHRHRRRRRRPRGHRPRAAAARGGRQDAPARAQLCGALPVEHPLCVLPFNPLLCSPQVINQVGAASLRATLNCDAFAREHSAESHFDKQSFVGLAVKVGLEPSALLYAP